MNKTRRNIYMDDNIYGNLITIAKERNISIAQLISERMQKYIDFYFTNGTQVKKKNTVKNKSEEDWSDVAESLN